MAKSNKPKRDMYAEITDKMVAALEAGTVPWRREWATTSPRSMATGKLYRGTNTFVLGLSANGEPGSNWWGTFNQIKNLGGMVRKGEKATTGILWHFIDKKNAQADDKKVPLLRAWPLFNATQADWADGMPSRFLPTENDHDTIAEAEAVWHNYLGRPALLHKGDRACYMPGPDEVHMPALNSFNSPEAYYSTLFHEAGHSTGHKDRLNREGIQSIKFGSHTYGLEELVAEMTAAFLCAHVGIGDSVFENSAAYLASWCETIKENPRMVITAAGQAQRAADHILGYKWEDEKED